MQINPEIPTPEVDGKAKQTKKAPLSASERPSAPLRPDIAQKIVQEEAETKANKEAARARLAKIGKKIDIGIMANKEEDRMENRGAHALNTEGEDMDPFVPIMPGDNTTNEDNVVPIRPRQRPTTWRERFKKAAGVLAFLSLFKGGQTSEATTPTPPEEDPNTSETHIPDEADSDEIHTGSDTKVDADFSDTTELTEEKEGKENEITGTYTLEEGEGFYHGAKKALQNAFEQPGVDKNRILDQIREEYPDLSGITDEKTLIERWAMKQGEQDEFDIKMKIGGGYTYKVTFSSGNKFFVHVQNPDSAFSPRVEATGYRKHEQKIHVQKNGQGHTFKIGEHIKYKTIKQAKKGEEEGKTYIIDGASADGGVVLKPIGSGSPFAVSESGLNRLTGGTPVEAESGYKTLTTEESGPDRIMTPLITTPDKSDKDAVFHSSDTEAAFDAATAEQTHAEEEEIVPPLATGPTATPTKLKTLNKTDLPPVPTRTVEKRDKTGADEVLHSPDTEVAFDAATAEQTHAEEEEEEIAPPLATGSTATPTGFKTLDMKTDLPPIHTGRVQTKPGPEKRARVNEDPVEDLLLVDGNIPPEDNTERTRALVTWHSLNRTIDSGLLGDEKSARAIKEEIASLTKGILEKKGEAGLGDIQRAYVQIQRRADTVNLVQQEGGGIGRLLARFMGKKENPSERMLTILHEEIDAATNHLLPDEENIDRTIVQN
jgi:hypothetical protein